MNEINNIIQMEGRCNFVDQQLRNHVEKLETRITNMNKRSLTHTLQIKELEKMVKDIKKVLKSEESEK